MIIQYKYIFFLLLLGSLLLGSCKAAKLRKDKAGEQIQKLKDGYLLVRLISKADKIKFLEDNNQRREAKKVKLEQEARNERIINAFVDSFSFCPVYFFHSKDGKAVREGNKSAVFTGAEYKKVNLEYLNSTEYLVAEFGRLEDNTGTGVLEGIKVMDENYQQIAKPFPSTIGGPTRNRNEFDYESTMVKIMDVRLQQYLLTAQTRASKRALKKARKVLLEDFNKNNN